jgi:hypothetical protein
MATSDLVSRGAVHHEPKLIVFRAVSQVSVEEIAGRILQRVLVVLGLLTAVAMGHRSRRTE